MPRPKKLDYRGEVELRKATRDGLTGRQALDYLLDLYGEGKIDGEVPELRAIQAAMRKYRTDPSGPWTITQAGPDEINVLMPVARAALQESEGRKRLTNREADFAVKINAAVPGLKASAVLEYARSYILCEERNQSSDHLDLALTLKPEKGVDLAQRYARAVGGDLTKLMVETLPQYVLYSVAQSWPTDVEAGSTVAGLKAEIETAYDEFLAGRGQRMEAISIGIESRKKEARNEGTHSQAR